MVGGGVCMDELNHWRLFLNSGSVLDYLAFKREQETENRAAAATSREETDEIPYRGTDHQGTEYR